MENNYRLKIKLGDYEFDAEGPHDVVQEQFRAFQDLVNASPKAPVKPSTGTPPGAETSTDSTADVDAALSKIMKVDSRVVSLTAKPRSTEEAVLLVLYGQRMMRDNESPTGSEVIDGINATGGIDMGRTDRMFERLARNGDVIMIGERRGKRYRLTNSGTNKAKQIAAALIALVS